MTKQRKHRKLILTKTHRNPLVVPVVTKGVQRHRDRKRESKNSHKELE